MGKIPVAKIKENPVQAGSKVKKELSAKKNVSRCYKKRISMLRRRISSLLDEKESWQAKNQDIIDNFNNEKKLSAQLKNDVYYWQRLYHEAIMSQNAFKVKQTDSISSCLKDIKATFPHLVGLSDTICRNQIRLTNLLNSSNTERRMKQHKVGPMVNGVPIQKPTIRLERLMLQQPQEQGVTHNDLATERGNVLTPIVEENEHDTDSHLEHISIGRRRKHRLGTGERWRMRKQQEQLEKEREAERKRDMENQRRSLSESSDSEDLMPVIRLQRVSGLLLTPKLLEVDRGRLSEAKGVAERSSDPDNRRLRPSEDPKEGCSWMHISPTHSNKKQEKRKPKLSSPSDSSSEESDSSNHVESKKVRSSLSLCNKTFTLKRKSSSSSSTANTSHDASESSKVEPDSTNNIEDVVFERASSASDYHGMDNCFTRSSVVLQERVSVGNNGTTSRISPLASEQSSTLTLVQRQSNSFCNNCTPSTSPQLEGKRIRKPKIYLYPGEETASIATVSKTKRGKTTATSSSNKATKARPSDSSKIPRKSSVKRKSIKTPKPSVEQRLSENLGEETASIATVSKTKRGKAKATSSSNKATKAPPSDISKIPRKSSVKKKSINTSKPSVEQRLSENLGESEGRNSRRIKGPTSYKEPPGNKKMRRP